MVEVVAVGGVVEGLRLQLNLVETFFLSAIQIIDYLHCKIKLVVFKLSVAPWNCHSLF